MSDDSNQNNRGPRKGGGAGGKGGGPRGGGFGRGPARSGAASGERKPFRARPEGGERPARSSDDRPARRFDKPAGQRDGASRPPRAGGDRPFRARPDGERTPFRERAGEGRPERGAGPDRSARRFDKPAAARDAGERPYRARPDGERSSSRPPRDGVAPRGRSLSDRDGKRPERPRHPRGEDMAAPPAVILPSLLAQEPERIAKVMARAGVASRRDSEAMIAEGRVSVNGKVLESPARDVGPDDVVLVDGEPLPARERTRMWLYHKPRGLVTTNHDPEGRPTVFDALPEELPRVLSIGRLDINTEGLLLLTNDGGLARMLELPETGWLRRYRVRAFGSVTQDRLDTLRDGVTIDGVSYGPIVARFERQQGSNTWLTVDLREGKNREVKTVLEHLGLDVNRLIRISFGPFQLADLPEGEVDEIRSRVLKDQLGEELMAKAGVDFDAPRRDELPAAPPSAQTREPRRAPSGDDRPRRRETGERDGKPERERWQSDAVRTPSLDDRSDKPWKRTVWRDEEAQPQRERKAPPRRGADPREERLAREATGAVKRERGNAITDPTGRRVLVERVSAPANDERRDPADNPKRRPDRLPRNARGDGQGRGPRGGASPDKRGERPARRPREDSAPRERGGERPERAPRDGAERPARRFTERSGEERPRGRSFGDKPGGAKSFGGKPGGGKSFGERPSGGKSFGGKSFGGKPGGRPSGGGRPGGGKGPRPGGAPRGKRD
jgi:23S rRNA pseudouridine2605 synthase